MFKIGTFSKLTFVSVRMLRYYDEINLFKPYYIDDFTNYRYYSAKQIPLLNKIVSLKNLGLKADEIRQIIKEDNRNKQIKLLLKKRKDLTKQIHDDELRLERLGKFIENYSREEIKMKYDAVIKKVPSIKVVAYKAEMSQYNEEGLLWQKFMELCGKDNIYPIIVKNGYCYARFFEEDMEEGKIHIEIGQEVDSLNLNTESLELKELEGIPMALSVLVTGDYEPNIQEGFNFVASYIEENNYEIIGAPRTVYLKGPGDESNPENYVTEIQVPIREKN